MDKWVNVIHATAFKCFSECDVCERDLAECVKLKKRERENVCLCFCVRVRVCVCDCECERKGLFTSGAVRPLVIKCSNTSSPLSPPPPPPLLSLPSNQIKIPSPTGNGGTQLWCHFLSVRLPLLCIWHLQISFSINPSSPSPPPSSLLSSSPPFLTMSCNSQRQSNASACIFLSPLWSVLGCVKGDVQISFTATHQQASFTDYMGRQACCGYIGYMSYTKWSVSV